MGRSSMSGCSEGRGRNLRRENDAVEYGAAVAAFFIGSKGVGGDRSREANGGRLWWSHSRLRF
jgi:hypothetical protein